MCSYTNLFNNYFKNTGLSYQTTGIVCDSAANAGKDLSFSFSDSQGIISDNKNILSSIDLSDVNVGLSEYGSQTKILAPNTSYLLSGNTSGPAYAAQFFNSCLNSEEYPEWEKYVNVQFNLSHMCNYRQVTTRYEIFRELGETTSFVDLVQELLDKQNANIQISIENITFQGIESEFIVFRSNQLGYEFVVTDLRLIPIYEDEDWADSPFTTDEMEFSRSDWDGGKNIGDFFPCENVDLNVINKIVNAKSNELDLSYGFSLEWGELIEFMESYTPDVHKLYELMPLRVYPTKYPNGAMSGLVLKVEYPDDASVLPIKINHIKDQISEFNPVTLAEDASLIQTNCDEGNIYSDWHTATVHDRVLFQEFRFNVRASYINPEENDVHDWMDGGIYVHGQVSDKVEDDGWVSGTRMITTSQPCSTNKCDKKYVTNRKCDHYCDNGWINESPMDYEDLYWADGHVDTQDFIGMYGYLNHVHKNCLWNNLGSMYLVFGSPNNENANDDTLIPSAFIYNPNNVPVKITYMMFS